MSDPTATAGDPAAGDAAAEAPSGATPTGASRRPPRRTKFTTRRVQGGDSVSGSHGGHDRHDSRLYPMADDSRATSLASRRQVGTIAPSATAPEPGPEQSADERVDDLQLHEDVAPNRFAEGIAPTIAYFRRVTSFLFTSPGRLTVLSVALVIAILAAGLSLSQATTERQQRLADLSATSEPLAHAAQNLYSSLSIADAAANTAFSRGILNADDQLRREYDDAIARATLSGTRAAAGITSVDSRQMRDITTVQQLLPIYTGLIESARTHSRMGNPVGSTYLAEASELMGSAILPHAASLYYDTSDSVAQQRNQLTRVPWVPLSGLAAAIAMLIFAQWVLARRTGRLINNGLAAATALMVIAFAAVAAVTAVSWRGPESFGGARSPVHLLTEARITAQQTRAAETVDLVHRRPGGDTGFPDSTDKVQGLLQETMSVVDEGGEGPDQLNLDDANRALTDWRESHALMEAKIADGKYDEAVSVATGPPDQPVSSVRAFGALDSALQSTIDHARLNLRLRLEDARSASQTLAAAVTVLTILAALGVALGFRQPLMEYL